MSKRVYKFSNQWKEERTVFLLPSISVSLIEYCLDISFLWFKFYTYIGPSDDFITKEIYTLYWGKRCSEYDSNCPNCMAWEAWDAMANK